MMTLFLSANELISYLTVKDQYIDSLLKEINSKIGDKILISEKDIKVKTGTIFSRKVETKRLYTVFFRLNNAGECQQYNFPVEGVFGQMVDKSHVATLLLGLLIGLDLLKEF